MARMGTGFLQRLLLLVLALGLSAAARAADYRFAPTPAWVVPQRAVYTSTPPDSVTNGVWYLLSDQQTRVEAGGRVSYRHFVSKALDSRGVGEIAEITLNFDPSYQTLTLHALNVIRNGQLADRLHSPDLQIQVLQRERELEYQVYDGSKTVNVVLRDLRVGDVIEYAYSVSGVNPVFGGRVAGGGDLQWAVPVRHAFVRLLAPAGRQFVTRVSSSAVQPQVAERGGWRDTRWEAHDVPGLKADADAPSGYDPYAWVAWSEFADWRAVAAWALPMYQPPSDLGPALAGAVTGIARSAP